MNWDELYECNNVNTAWNIILTHIMSIINNMCPLKNYKISQAKEPWVTNEILEMIKDKDRLLRRAKKKKTLHDWEIAKAARNNTNLQIRRAKANFI